MKNGDNTILLYYLSERTKILLWLKMSTPIDFDKEKQTLQKALAHPLKNALKKLRSLEFSLEQCKKWPELHHEALLLQANLYQWDESLSSLIVSDWEKGNTPLEIKLSKPFNRQKEISQRFQTSRRQRLGIPRIEKEIIKAKAVCHQLENQAKILEASENIEDLIAYRKQFLKTIATPKLSAQKIAKALPYREFYSAAGLQILVGKKAKDNDILTFKIANGSDYWLHVHGYPGSHVVIKCMKGKEPDEESLRDALNLAFYYSQAKSQGRAEILVTQKKYVSPFGKGSKSPGKVQVSKHKLISIKLDPQRIERLNQK